MTTKDAIAFWYEGYLGPVIGAPEALERIRERRRKASLDFADRIVKQFPSILGPVPVEPVPVPKSINQHLLAALVPFATAFESGCITNVPAEAFRYAMVAVNRAKREALAEPQS